jgi:ABC-type uncharacterized transport system permease subunit
MKISSHLTILTQIFLILFGLPIAFLTLYKLNYSITGFAICFLLLAFVYFVLRFTAKAFYQNDNFIFKKLFRNEISVPLEKIVTFKKYRTTKYDYFWINVAEDSFLIISPVFGESKKILHDLYHAFQQQSTNK